MDLRGKTISPKMKKHHLILCDLPKLGLLVFFMWLFLVLLSVRVLLCNTAGNLLPQLLHMREH